MRLERYGIAVVSVIFRDERKGLRREVGQSPGAIVA